MEIKMKIPTPPEGYRLMEVGERPTSDDLSFSILWDSGWSKTMMNNNYVIETVPTIWPRKGASNLEYALVWATKRTEGK